MKKGILAVSVFVLVLLLLMCAGNSKRGNGGTTEVEVVDWSEASTISELFLKSFLKFPDEVIFVDDSKKVIEEGNKIFKVTGRLKSKNSFGQYIPYTYNIRIKYNGGDWSDIRGGLPVNWGFMGGNLYDESTREFTELK